MLRTTNIFSVLALSLTILGLAVIFKGGIVDVQMGIERSIRIESATDKPD